MRSLRDRVAVITGAASGIGQALGQHLARHGCHLALVDVDANKLRHTTEQLKTHGQRISTHLVDVANREQVAALPSAILEEHHAIHLLINNAGVSLAGPFASYSLDDLDWIIGVNLWGAIHACYFLLPHLQRAKSGHIVNISSDFGLLGMPTKSAYCTTKFALRGFSEALRAELHKTHIGVTCVYPGAVDTALIHNSRTSNPIKRDSEARFVAERGIPIDKVAQRIIRGIQRNEGRVLIGRDTYTIDFATRLAPRLTNTLIARLHHRLPFV